MRKRRASTRESQKRRHRRLVLESLENRLLLTNDLVQDALTDGTVSVYAAGRGYPWINLQDGRDLQSPFAVRDDTREGAGEYQAPQVDGSSLASADFDEDGVPDLVCGYADGAAGMIAFYRGNIDSLWPNMPAAQQRKAEGTFKDIPFFFQQSFSLPVAPDFMGAGDFDADGHQDVVVAMRGSNAFYVLSGNGGGGFTNDAKRIELPSAVTALVAGDLDAPDGLDDVAVAVSGPQGAELLVFAGSKGVVKTEPEFTALPAEATGLTAGRLDDDHTTDLAVAAGSDVVIVHGRDQTSLGPGGADAESPPAATERISLPLPITSVAVGDFVSEGNYQVEMAVLGNDGIVHVFHRQELVGAPAAPSGTGGEAEVGGRQAWQSVQQLAIPGVAPGSGAQLIGARVSTVATDDLVAIDSASHRVHILMTEVPHVSSAEAEGSSSASSSGTAAVALDVTRGPVALLPMRLNSDGLSDLVILQEGEAGPVVAESESQSTFVVNSTSTSGDGDTTDGKCDTGSQQRGFTNICTLAAALNEASANQGATRITFNIPGAGPHTISQGFTNISPTVTIDGTTQPGYSGTPLIELTGLEFKSANDVVVRGLAINHFQLYGIYIDSSTGAHVEGNFVGVDATGTSAAGGYYGVYLQRGSGHTVGGTTDAARNIISGNSNWEVSVRGGHTVSGNFIGTDVTGRVGLGGQSGGVIVYDASNTIGGTSPGAGNLISGNKSSGVSITNREATGNLVQGNLIGTDVTGMAPLGNTGVGVGLGDRAHDNTIGGTAPGAGNVISGNHGGGVAISVRSAFSGDPYRNYVQGNLIGTGLDGVTPVPNRREGVYLRRAHTNLIGGEESGAANIIAHNYGHGVHVAYRASANRISRNSIYENGGLGIELAPDASSSQASPEISRAKAVGAELEVSFRVPSSTRYASYPLEIEFFIADDIDSAEGKTFLGTVPYTEAEAQTWVTKRFVPTQMPAKNRPIVGTATDSNGHTSKFSSPPAIVDEFLPIIVNSTGDDKDVPGDNRCDVDVSTPGDQCTLRAALELANVHPGEDTIIFDLPESVTPTIRPSSQLPPILHPVRIDGSADVDLGMVPKVELDGSNAGAANGLVIRGGGSTVEELIINRFSGHGIVLEGKGGNTIKGNLIGTNREGNTDSGNAKAGILIDNSPDNTIGGTTDAPGLEPGNLISGNDTYGIEIRGALAAGNKVRGNGIGTDRFARGALGNASHGVLVTGASNNQIGGVEEDAGNKIAHNGGSGVAVLGSDTRGVSILGNFIYKNVELGIDLGGDGVTLNDKLDQDEGPNRLVNFPVITSVTGEVLKTLEGVLHGAPNTTYVLDVFANDVADPTDFGEGQVFVGTLLDTMTDEDGFAPFFIADPDFKDLKNFTLTATDPDGNTSEFSRSDAPIYVNDPGDEKDADVRDGVCDADLNREGKQCTLRAAIEQSNELLGPNTVVFDIPVDGVPKIQPLSELPAITEKLVVDATTQRDSSSGFYNVRLDGSRAGPTASGFRVSADSADFNKLHITRFRGWGINALRGGRLKVGNSSITHNGAGGIRMEARSGTEIAGSKISLGSVSVFHNGGPGIKQIGDLTISGYLRDSAITLNGGDGISIYGGLLLEGNNEIRNNRGSGVEVLDAEGEKSSRRQGSFTAQLFVGEHGSLVIADNDGWGVKAGARVDIRVPARIEKNGLGGVLMHLLESRVGKLTLGDVEITENGGPGLKSTGGLGISNSWIVNSVILRNQGDGISVHGRLELVGSNGIIDNRGSGIEVRDADVGTGAVRRDGVFGANAWAGEYGNLIVTKNDGWGIKAGAEVQVSVPASIKNNGLGGVLMELPDDRFGRLHLQEAEVTGNGGPGVISTRGIGLNGEIHDSVFLRNRGDGVSVYGRLNLAGSNGFINNRGTGIEVRDAGTDLSSKAGILKAELYEHGNLIVNSNDEWGIRAGAEVDLRVPVAIRRNGLGGIRMEISEQMADSELYVVSGEIEDNGGPGIKQVGANIRDARVRDLKVLDNKGDGISILGDISIHGANTITDNRGTGISARNVVGENLTIVQNGEHGIKASRDVTIHKGQICRNGGRGILFDGRLELRQVQVNCGNAQGGIGIPGSNVEISTSGTTNLTIGAVSNPSPQDAPTDLVFPFGFFAIGMDLQDSGDGESPATAHGESPTAASDSTVTISLPPGRHATTYYKYGPTPENPTDHWYEFLFDGTTGAEILGDRIILHFVDGQRGDNDLTVNGAIADPGGPAAGPSGSISGYVYADVNNNGIKEPHELGLPNVPITVIGPVTSTMVTDGDGRYDFLDLPVGQYTVTQSQPSAFNDGIESLGPAQIGRVEGEAFVGVDLTAGTDAEGYNFGERGLRGEFVSRWYLMNSTPPADQYVLQLTDGIGATSFKANSNGTFTASGEGERLASIELYTADMMPVAIGAAGQPLSTTVAEGESYVLLVTGSDGPVDLQTDIQPLAQVYLTNALNPFDVDGSGMTTPLDVLVLINALNAGSAVDGSQVYYVDVNSDKQLSPLDVLTVINHLSASAGQSSASGGEGEPSSQFELPFEPDDSLGAVSEAWLCAGHTLCASHALCAGLPTPHTVPTEGLPSPQTDSLYPRERTGVRAPDEVDPLELAFPPSERRPSDCVIASNLPTADSDGDILQFLELEATLADVANDVARVWNP